MSNADAAGCLTEPPFSPDSLIAAAIARVEETARPLGKCDANSLAPAVQALGKQWIEGFIMKPHKDLGRDGPVCPFVELSYTADSIYAASFPAHDFDFENFVQIILRLPRAYKKIMARDNLSSLLFSLIIFLPNLTRDKFSQLIDLTQIITKPVFMNAGLMIGEFHPESRVGGVHSSRFHPMRSLVPAFVIRSIAPHDLLFIDRDNSPTAVRINELECFLAWVKVSAQKEQLLKKRIGELKYSDGSGVPIWQSIMDVSTERRSSANFKDREEGNVPRPR